MKTLKGTKVYTVTESYVTEDGCHSNTTEIYADINDARKRYADLRAEIERTKGSWESEESINDEGYMSYEAYEEGYYDSNHYSISLDEKVIK